MDCGICNCAVAGLLSTICLIILNISQTSLPTMLFHGWLLEVGDNAVMGVVSSYIASCMTSDLFQFVNICTCVWISNGGCIFNRGSNVCLVGNVPNFETAGPQIMVEERTSTTRMLAINTSIPNLTVACLEHFWSPQLQTQRQRPTDVGVDWK